MCTILGYSGRDCALIIFFNFMAIGLNLFNLVFQVRKYTPPPLPIPSTFILEEEVIQYQYYNLIQFLNNISKIIPSQNTVVIILQMLKSLTFLQQVKVRPQFVDTLFIIRLRPNMSICYAIIINYYFLVQKIEVQNLILLSTCILL